MDRWLLPDPKKLAKRQLAEIVGQIQDFMYVEEWVENRKTIAPDVSIAGSDLVEVVGDLMLRYGLVPEEVRSTKDWRPEA